MAATCACSPSATPRIGRGAISEHVLIWTGGGYKIYKDDGSGKPKETLWHATNGHESYIPGTNNQWIVTDTYASQSNKRDQILYLYHLPTNRVVVLGKISFTEGVRGR